MFGVAFPTMNSKRVFEARTFTRFHVFVSELIGLRRLVFLFETVLIVVKRLCRASEFNAVGFRASVQSVVRLFQRHLAFARNDQLWKR